MTDIKNRSDLENIIRIFYSKAIPDEIIGHFFTGVVAINWEEHIQTVTDFWDSMIFGTSEYTANPMTPHVKLHELSTMKQPHFDRWLQLFTGTITENYNGKVATEVIQRATSIAKIMAFKIVPVS